jgi:aminodeoxyfutalosine synthase
MIGKATTQLSLSFGVDDIDGTIEDSTKIYSMAGVEDKNPVLTKIEMIELIKDTRRTPVERDSLYNPVKKNDF